ncbi:MAG: hypothetical protein KGJ02_00080 [Verrucomicrobiota bacterium]|nr:hypothetical protein [Verrucomicrobiota bacterium]
MNRWILFSASCFTSLLAAQQAAMPLPMNQVAQVADVQYQEKQEESDMDALRRWLQDKRFISLKETGGDLTISGEVRTECQYINEKSKAQGSSQYIQQRGQGSPLDKPNLVWDVEFNLILDYRSDRAWAAMKLEFDNDMGTRSGTVNKIRLEKAYLGGRLIAGDTLTWDAEIGRRYLSNAFDSKIEFGSLFDGLLFRFGKAFEEIGDFYANLAAFLIDDRNNSYGEVMELGALGVANTGLNLKYSIINWFKPGIDSDNPNRWRFLVNQFLVSYQMYPEWLGKRYIKFYGAGLFNALAQDVVQTGYNKQQSGWYLGTSIGVVKKARDWAVDVNFQWVQAQAIPDADVSGIGRGNAAGVGFYSNPISGGAPTTQSTAVGNCNYYGMEIEALYAFTDNLTLLQNLKWANTLDTDIGPNLKYKQWEIEFIYAF